MKEILITNTRTLKMLNKAGLVIWPYDNAKFKYVDTVNDNYQFTHKKVDYILRFHDGCFMPYVYAKVPDSILVKENGIVTRQKTH